ncbi:uncharacterized protein KY384_004185 [Bacidia gigantensis]|uniref:uncharacterized protein n=1 Tax=Bacidia gigantensis TaxID=2732470 RepID=UPI001D055688|nr:uncharacterized protein KY384_004185 [Bacidia gigantensis]KAG8530828.1 hypothetical protein KY384_004185 [Bacidia gigantensis]
MAAPKIAKYSLSELKNTTDDALPNYLNSLKFNQAHFLTDVKLALGYSAVTIAGVLFYADWKLGWDATKGATLWAVMAYFTLNSILTFWIWGVERGKVYSGEFNGTLISVASSTTKYTPLYDITVRLQSPMKEETNLKLSAPFTRWFDADGCFIAKPFQQWLSTEVPLIGQADPKSKQGKIEGTNGGIQVAEAVLIHQNETPKKATGHSEGTPSTRSRKGKK